MIDETLESGVADADTQSCDDAARIALRRTFEDSDAELSWEQSSMDVQRPTSSSRSSPGSERSLHPRRPLALPAVNADYRDVRGTLRLDFVL